MGRERPGCLRRPWGAYKPRPMSTPPEAADGLPKRSFAILFGVSLAMAIGNTGLLSVLPAISRSIGIPDFLAAAVF